MPGKVNPTQCEAPHHGGLPCPTATRPWYPWLPPRAVSN
jgi:hypothetical protein